MGYGSLSPSLSKQHIHTLQLLHLFQTYCSGDPHKADQSSHLPPPLPDRIARDIQARNGPLESLRPTIISVSITASDAQDCIFHVAVMLLFHRFGGLALALALGAVFAKNVAGEDFDLGDEV